MIFKNIFSKKEKRILSIALDEHKVRFLEATMRGNQMVSFHQCFTIENNIIDEGGTINRNIWKSVLKQQIKEHQIKAKKVHVVIPSSFIIVRHIDVPDIKPKDIRRMIHFEIGKTIHLPFESPIIDFFKTNLIANNENDVPMAKIVIVAAPENLIKPLVSGLISNKLRPQMVGIPVLSLYRLFSLQHQAVVKEPFVLSFITSHGIDLHILDEGIVWLSRHIPVEINYENKRFLNSLISDIANEMDRAINFYKYTLSNNNKKMIGAWIATDIPLQNDFYQLLQENIDIPVDKISYSNDFAEANALFGYEVALGSLYEEGYDYEN